MRRKNQERFVEVINRGNYKKIFSNYDLENDRNRFDFIGDFMKSLSIFIAVLFLQQTTFAGLPVLPAQDQKKLLENKDTQLAANKKLVYDFTRIILSGRRLERASEFLTEDYIQHNPNVETGLKGFVDFFSQLGGPRDIPETVKGLVSIQAENDIVTMSFVNDSKDAAGAPYSTTWFDMFRVKDGKIIEHWDCDTK